MVEQYDKRADAENLIGEAKQEGLDAIPSGKFKNNYAFFQVAMPAYNLWRYFKLLANLCGGKVKMLAGIADNKIRIARLKRLTIGAKGEEETEDNFGNIIFFSILKFSKKYFFTMTGCINLL